MSKAITQQDTSPEMRFKNNLDGLKDLLVDLISEASNKGFTSIDPNMVKMAMGMASLIDKHTLIRGFIERSHKFWNLMLSEDNENEHQALKRKQDFIIKNSGLIFSDVPLDKVNAIKILFTEKSASGDLYITDEDKEDIWLFFEAMVKCSIHYYNENDGAKLLLKDRLPSDFDIVNEASKWKIKLK